MAYNPVTDFLALLRQTSGGVRAEAMPGMDYALAAMARMGLFDLWANPTAAPTSNLATTVWLKTSATSWAAEGSVFLYNSNTGQFEPATPALWQSVFAASGAGAVFQSVVAALDAVNALTTLVAVQRDNPGVTTLTLPPVAVRNKPLQIVDWSTNVAAHQIIITPAGGETIMRAASWSLYSTADQLSSGSLYPSLNLHGWVIAP